jgi:hypothetical protein
MYYVLINEYMMICVCNIVFHIVRKDIYELMK